MFWLSGWTYRKSHVINPAAGAGAGYQIRVAVHYGAGTDTGENVYCGSRCRSDFGDIRFTDDNNTLLDFWMQTKTDGDNAVFWVKIAANLDAASQTIYVYYGKSDASTTSNQTATFVNVISGVVGAWSLEDGTIGQTGIPATDSSGQGNNGIASGTTVVSGKFAGKNARQFNGTSDFITVTDSNSLDLTTQLTIICFAKYATSETGFILAKGNPNTERVYNLYLNAGIDKLIVTDSGSDKTSNAVFTEDNTWTYLGLTVNNTDLTFNHNGSSAGTASIEASYAANANNLVIGNRPGGSSSATYLAATLCNVCVINGTLTQTQHSNCANNYPDISLQAGSILVRKWATTTQPSHDAWGTLEHFVAASEAFSLADTVFGHKAISLTDSLAADNIHETLKNLVVADAADLADLVLALKKLNVADWLVLSDVALVPSGVRRALDGVCVADGLRIDKVMQIADEVFVVEVADVGKGDRRSRLYLVLGNVALQLNKNQA